MFVEMVSYFGQDVFGFIFLLIGAEFRS